MKTYSYMIKGFGGRYDVSLDEIRADVARFRHECPYVIGRTIEIQEWNVTQGCRVSGASRTLTV